MSKVYNVAVLVGSLRKDSLNRKVAHALAHLAPPHVKLNIVEIGELALYNEDIDVTPAPAPYTAFRDQVRQADAVLFVTPEYNRSVPGALKNAIDVGSRPYGQSVFSGKPGAVISVSPGAIGGFGANHHLRQSLVFLNVPCMQQPEAYNIENVITAIKNRSEDYNAGVRLHGKPQTMLTDDAVYIVENGYTL